jgi:hypothetical protein
VTMETKGVSRQVAVELDEVDRWASPATEAPAESPAPSAALDLDTGEPLVEIVPAPPAPPAEALAEVRPRRSRARRSAPPAGETAATALAPDSSQ